MKSALFLMLCGCVLLVDAPASGEDEVDCANAMTQFDMNACAQKDYEAADARLNAQWKLTKTAMADVDSGLDEALKGASKALLDGQRAWIAYRDAQCTLAGFEARGGSMEPMLVSGCLAELTDARTKELKALADGLGN
ncbi:DUF1311 domain-containing protein [Rhizobium sp. CG5]|uniref:lysozyme inhibitor LprI family protein n=1 Tax=Rhizobium sp. CG5 TaxID=2726076 RepID=UPI00203387F7|nr:lysozyme inhibitor LprI family protein [Rhizobium sp. CG5]MCM2473219.1 DUF1311 domain-containing protein [Rhizobium sp. CG5]